MPAMEHGSEGFEHIAVAILEMRQSIEVLLAENRRLHAELAALRQGMGMMVVIEGRLFSLGSGLVPPEDPRFPSR